MSEPIGDTPATATEAPEAAEVAPPAIVLTAAAIEWLGERWEAKGPLTIAFSGEFLVGASASGTRAEMTVREGTWTRKSGEIRFDEATLSLADHTGLAVGVRAVVGEATLSAGQLTANKDDFMAREATLSPCACADGKPAALSFRANSIEVVEARVAIVRGGTLRLFTVPILPVPYWRIPLDPNVFRLSVPEVGYGDPGVSARWHGTWGFGAYRFDAGPAWRQDRGGRLEFASAGPIRSAAEVGWDNVSGSVRGAVATEGGYAGDWGRSLRVSPESPLRDRAAADISVLSDLAYAEDFGLAYVDRGVPFRESRAVAQLGVFRVQGWFPDVDPGDAQLATLSFRPRWASAWGSFQPFVGVGIAGFEGTQAVFSAGTTNRAGKTFGALHLEAAVDAALAAGSAELDAFDAASFGEGRVELATWGDGPLGRFTLLPGVLGRLNAGVKSGEFQEPTVAGGPSVRMQSRVGELVATMGGAVLLSANEVQPEVSLDLAGTDLAIIGTWTQNTQAFDLRVGHDLVARVGLLHVGGDWFTVGDVALHAGRFVSALGVNVDPVPEVDDLRILNVGVPLGIDGALAKVGYDDGCSSFVLTASLAADRDLPDFGAQVSLRK